MKHYLILLGFLCLAACSGSVVDTCWEPDSGLKRLKLTDAHKKTLDSLMLPRGYQAGINRVYDKKALEDYQLFVWFGASADPQKLTSAIEADSSFTITRSDSALQDQNGNPVQVFQLQKGNSDHLYRMALPMPEVGGMLVFDYWSQKKPVVRRLFEKRKAMAAALECP